MNRKLSVHHYQPEIKFLESKQRIGARICTDVCCIADARDNFRILASRGFPSDTHPDFPTAAGMTEDERALFFSTLERGHRFYFCIRKKPWLIFTDWLKATGLLLILSPKSDAFATKEALSQFGMQRFAFPQAFRESTLWNTAAWQDAFDILSDTFALLDNLTDAARADSKKILTSVALLSGCRLEYSEPEAFAALSATQLCSPRSLAFLFCTFLFLHRQCKTVSVQDETDPPVPCCLSLHYPNAQTGPASVPSFSSHPCFDACSLQYGNGTATVLLSEVTSATVLGAPHHAFVNAISFSISITS